MYIYIVFPDILPFLLYYAIIILKHNYYNIYSKIIIICKGVKIMYPVQLMISYFTTSFTAIMHIGREVTAKQYTGGDLQDSKGTYIKKQAQEWVRLVSYRYKEGQCRHILSFLACLHSFVISNYWLPPVCHSVWNDRSMTMFV